MKQLDVLAYNADHYTIFLASMIEQLPNGPNLSPPWHLKYFIPAVRLDPLEFIQTLPNLIKLLRKNTDDFIGKHRNVTYHSIIKDHNFKRFELNDIKYYRYLTSQGTQTSGNYIICTPMTPITVDPKEFNKILKIVLGESISHLR